MTATIHKQPGASFIPAFDNVQGTFQFCRTTGYGEMTISCTEGTATVRLDAEMMNYILLHLPERERA